MKGVALSLAVVAWWAASVRVSAQPPVTFTNEWPGMGIPLSGASVSAAWFDFDADGDLDLCVGNGGSGLDPLLRQNDDGTFTDVTEAVGLVPNGFQTPGTQGITTVDYDNDGDLDIYICNNDRSHAGQEQNFMYRNKGDGTYEEVAVEIGLGDMPFSGQSMGWFDFNGDGLLDGYLPRVGEPGVVDVTQALLFVNLGDGTFENRIDGTGLEPDLRDKFYPIPFDYDNDGDLDVAVNVRNGMILYRNNGDESFTDVTAEAELSYTAISISLATGDYDNDGDLDLYASLAFNGRNILYRNNGDGTFTDVTLEAGVPGSFPSPPIITRYFGVMFEDFDNDGWLDLYLPCQTNSLVLTFNNLFYHNNGDGTFSEIGAEVGLADPSNHIGAAAGDYDGNGFLDIFSAGQGSPSALYRNGGNANHWLSVDLVGTTSNRTAIGARVTLRSGDLTQIRERVANSVWGGQNDLRAHYGLGSRTRIDSLVVRWPTGIVEAFDPPGIDQSVTLIEGQGRPSAVKSFRLYLE